MNRRKVLVSTGVFLSASLPGCSDRRLDSGESDDRDDGNGENATDTVTSNDDNTSEKSTESENRDSSNDKPTDEKEYTYDESRQDSIFIQNTTDDEIVVELLVEEKSDNEVLIENVYTVPEKTGLEIPDIADVKNEYAVTATYDEMVEKFDWRVQTCASSAGPETGGETALEVGLFDDGFTISSKGCDVALVGDNFDLEYVYHGNFIQED